MGNWVEGEATKLDSETSSIYGLMRVVWVWVRDSGSLAWCSI